MLSFPHPFKVPTQIYRPKQHAATIQQLFILTGVKAELSTKSLDTTSVAPYFRFYFDKAKEGFERACMILDFFGIEYIVETMEKEETRLIGVYYNEMIKINHLFINHDFPKDPLIHPVSVDNLSDRQRLDLVNFLFSYKTSGELEERNNSQYDLTGVMLRITDYVIHKLTSLDYLYEKGFSFKIKAPPEPEPDNEDDIIKTVVPTFTKLFTDTVDPNKKPLVNTIVDMNQEKSAVQGLSSKPEL